MLDKDKIGEMSFGLLPSCTTGTSRQRRLAAAFQANTFGNAEKRKKGEKENKLQTRKAASAVLGIDIIDERDDDARDLDDDEGVDRDASNIAKLLSVSSSS